LALPHADATYSGVADDAQAENWMGNGEELGWGMHWVSHLVLMLHALWLLPPWR
jgi:hypothetical protein